MKKININISVGKTKAVILGTKEQHTVQMNDTILEQTGKFGVSNMRRWKDGRGNEGKSNKTRKVIHSNK